MRCWSWARCRLSVEDADADTPDEQPLFGEPGFTPERTAWQHSRVIALLASEHEPAVLLAAAANELGPRADAFVRSPRS